jgi:YgiT-type zinc finger domain-containing protein
MKCTVAGCSGYYEPRRVLHTVRHHGTVVVIDQVPAEVCPVCGDILLRPDTIQPLERLLESLPQPRATIPLYGYA